MKIIDFILWIFFAISAFGCTFYNPFTEENSIYGAQSITPEPTPDIPVAIKEGITYVIKNCGNGMFLTADSSLNVFLKRDDNNDGSRYWGFFPYSGMVIFGNYLGNNAIVDTISEEATLDGAVLKESLYVNNFPEQFWQLNYTGNGKWKFIYVPSEMVMSAKNNTNQDGLEVIQTNYTADDYQLWEIILLQ